MSEIKYIEGYCDSVENEIKRKLNYDNNTGEITWKRVEPLSSGDKLYNTRFAGKTAGSIKRTQAKNGYIEIHLKGKMLRAHRVAWFLVYGEWPKGEIDHINNDRSDNKVGNLRVVNRSTQNKNTCRRKDNSSGVTGVSWCTRSKRWLVSIQYNKKRVDLGKYEDWFDAVCARKSSENIYKFSDNHGRNLSKYAL